MQIIKNKEMCPSVRFQEKKWENGKIQSQRRGNSEEIQAVCKRRKHQENYYQRQKRKKTIIDAVISPIFGSIGSDCRTGD